MAKHAIKATVDDGFYTLVPRDQQHLNLVLLRKTRPLTAKEKIEGRSARPDARPPNIEIDAKYARLICPSCSAIDPGHAFDAGFDGDRTIRMDGDFGFSDDGFFLINRRMLTALRQGKVKGFEAAPVGKDWFAVKFTCVVESAPGVWKPKGRRCRACGRPQEMIGGYDRLSQLLELPKGPKTLFAPRAMNIRGRPWFRLDAPTPMVSGDIVPILLQHGIKGGACRKLLSEGEWRQHLRNARKTNVFLDPPGVIVLR